MAKSKKIKIPKSVLDLRALYITINYQTDDCIFASHSPISSILTLSAANICTSLKGDGNVLLQPMVKK